MKYVVFCSRIVWRLAVVTIISLAVLITLGRELADRLTNYQAEIETFVSQRLGMRVATTQLHGDWSGFSPSLTVTSVDIFSDGSEAPVISTKRLKAHPDLLASLLTFDLEWRELSVERLSLSLLERDDGSWSLAGLPESNGGTNFQNLLNMLQRSTYLKINEAVLDVQFASGEKSTVRLRNTLIENSGSFHRLAASIAFEDAAESAKLVIEGNGDLLDFDQFAGTAYLRLQRLNFQGPVSALLKRWLPAIEKQTDFEAAVEAELWSSKTKGEGASLSGYLKAAEIPLLAIVDAPPIKDFRAEITGAYHPGEDWTITLQDIDFQWSDFEIEPLTISYRQEQGDPLGFGTISVDHLNLNTLAELLQANQLLPQRGLEILAALRPAGSVSAAHLRIRPGGEAARPRVSLRANLQDVAINSWKKAPASRKINGYLELQGADGVLDLDSPDGFEMLYPTVYDDYMVHPSARGQIRWRIDREASAVKVSSGPIELGGETGNGAAYLYLDIPLKRQRGPGEMFLQVGLRDSHSRFRDMFVPRTLNPRVLQWLDEAVGDADIREAGFIWRGSLSSKEHAKRSVQLYLNALRGNLKFQRDWPALSELEAVVTVDGSTVTASIDSARIGDVGIGKTGVLVRSEKDTGPKLYVTGVAAGDAGAAVQVLANSPLRNRVGALSDWPLTGNAEATVDLTIPLGANSGASAYKVDAAIRNARLTDPDGEFIFERVSGDLRYRDETGLTGDKLTANLWGNNPLSGHLKTVNEAVVLSMDGHIDVTELLGKIELPLDSIVAGSTPYHADLTLAPGESPTLSIRSPVQGVSVDLPEPFGKSADPEGDFNLDIEFLDGLSRYRGQHSGQIYFDFELAEGSMRNGVLSINKPTDADEGRTGLLLDGLLHDVTLDEWLPVYEKLKVFGGGEAAVSQQVRLKIDNFNLDNFTLHDVTLTGAPDAEQGWQFSFASDKAIGDITFPADEALPFSLSLQSLNLDAPERQQNGASAFADIDPAELPFVNFSVDKLVVGETVFGSLAFLVQPLDKGVELQNISGELFGLVLGASLTEEGEAGAVEETRLAWLKDGEDYRSSFSGVVGASDVADVLTNFEAPKIIDSKQASFVIDLNWRGAPDQINRDSLSGSLVLALRDGEFYRTPRGAGNAVIRMVGLFNFANWLRRLRLDFSDLFAEGMTYDSLRGGVKFDQGVMAFDAPIVVKMPSGRMKLSGSADILAEQLDAHLVVTVPVGTNLPWVVALAGGLPAAAGVYITSKLFEKQLDKLSSLSYVVTGSWDEPEVKVDRIFSDKGAVADTAPNGEQATEP